MSEKYVLVPQSDIDKLEAARVELCDMLGHSQHFLNITTFVTPAMHQITHREYPEGVAKLPGAMATLGHRNTIVIKDCPYCHATHYHGGGGLTVPVNGPRMADCGHGQYYVIFDKKGG